MIHQDLSKTQKKNDRLTEMRKLKPLSINIIKETGQKTQIFQTEVKHKKENQTQLFFRDGLKLNKYKSIILLKIQQMKERLIFKRKRNFKQCKFTLEKKIENNQTKIVSKIRKNKGQNMIIYLFGRNQLFRINSKTIEQTKNTKLRIQTNNKNQKKAKAVKI